MPGARATSRTATVSSLLGLGPVQGGGRRGRRVGCGASLARGHLRETGRCGAVGPPLRGGSNWCPVGHELGQRGCRHGSEAEARGRVRRWGQTLHGPEVAQRGSGLCWGALSSGLQACSVGGGPRVCVGKEPPGREAPVGALGGLLPPSSSPKDILCLLVAVLSRREEESASLLGPPSHLLSGYSYSPPSIRLLSMTHTDTAASTTLHSHPLSLSRYGAPAELLGSSRSSSLLSLLGSPVPFWATVRGKQGGGGGGEAGDANKAQPPPPFRRN